MACISFEDLIALPLPTKVFISPKESFKGEETLPVTQHLPFLVAPSLGGFQAELLGAGRDPDSEHRGGSVQRVQLFFPQR